MNNNLKCDVLRTACSDEWIAKTYSEYLLTCANNKLTFLNMVTDLVADEDIDGWIDTRCEEYTGFMSEANQLVIENIPDNLEGLESIDRDSAAFFNAIEDLCGTEEEPGDIVIWYQTYINPSTQFNLIKRNLRQYDFDELLDMSVIFKQTVDTKTSLALQSLGYDPSVLMLSMNEGYVNARQLISKMVVTTSLSVEYDIDIPAVNTNNESISNLKLSLNDIWDEFKSQYASSICWSQGFLAVTKSTVADRLAYFEALMSTYFSDAKEKWATSISTVKTMIASTSDRIGDFISQAEDMLGWTDVVEGLNGTVLDETDVVNYTGASPLSDIDLNTAKGVATAVVKTVAAVGYGIFQGIKNLCKKAWSIARPFAMALTDNPVDIGVVDKSAKSYTIENWCYNAKERQTYFKGGRLASMEQTDFNRLIQTLSDKLDNKWIAYKTYFGEILFKVNSISNPTGRLMWIDYDYQLKPRVLDIDKMKDYDLVNVTSNSIGTGPIRILKADGTIDTDYTQACDTMDFYLEDETDEKKAYMGLQCSLMMLAAIAKAACRELNITADTGCALAEYIGYADYTGSDYSEADILLNALSNNTYYYTNTNTGLPSWNVTNLDFLKVASGYNTNSRDVSWGDCRFNEWTRVQYDADASSHMRYVYHGMDVDILNYFIYIFCVQAVDKIDNPTNYLYVPYSSDNYTWEEPRYKIKTDADNKNVANIIVNVLTAIAVVALAVIVCKGIIKFVKNKKWAKVNAIKGKMDNQMWQHSGKGYKKLNPLEARKYARYTNKINKMSGATSGLAAGPSIYEYCKDNFGTISNLISGQENSLLNNSSDDPKTVVNNDFDTKTIIYKAITGVSLQ